MCLSAPDVFDVIIWGRAAGVDVRTRRPSGLPGASHSEKKMDWAPQIVSSDDFLFSASSTGQLFYHFHYSRKQVRITHGGGVDDFDLFITDQDFKL